MGNARPYTGNAHAVDLETATGPLAAIADDGGMLEAIPLTGIIQTAAGSFQAVQGMAVVGADGVQVGTLKEMRPADILVDRTWQRDVYVPYEAIQGVRDEAIVLAIPADQVEQMGWPHPPLLPGLPE